MRQQSPSAASRGRTRLRPWTFLAAAVTLAPLRASAATPLSQFAPMNYLQTFSRSGEAFTPLLWGLIVQSVVVVVIITALVLVGVWLRRWRRRDLSQPLPVTRRGTGAAWIGIGVGLSTIALLATMVWTVGTMAAIDRNGTDPAVTIEVVGHQWWWEFRYIGKEPSRTFVTANEMHIPVGEPVQIRLTGADVIHSFWIPALAGKTDAVPGQTNVMFLDAETPGVYRGQCTEYCGEQHANMALIAFADAPADFQAWWDKQLQSASPPATTAAQTDVDTFVQRCGACHTVRGTLAGGRLGPDLSHLMSRTTIAAGILPNTIAYLSGWIANPQTLKPGNQMPAVDLSGPELSHIRDFLLAQQ